jgi:hypothetical protein
MSSAGNAGEELAKNAIAKGAFPVEVVVDSNTSCENVIRMAEKNGCKVESEVQGCEIKVTISR